MKGVNMTKKSVKVEPVVGRSYYCICEHWHTGRRIGAFLRRVEEDDQSWRTVDDNSELSYDWNVIGIYEI